MSVEMRKALDRIQFEAVDIVHARQIAKDALASSPGEKEGELELLREFEEKARPLRGAGNLWMAAEEFLRKLDELRGGGNQAQARICPQCNDDHSEFIGCAEYARKQKEIRRERDANA